jgi:hypothetical protein
VPELVIEALEDPVVLALELTVFEAVCMRGGKGCTMDPKHSRAG